MDSEILLEGVKKVARDAGKVLLSYFGVDLKLNFKKDNSIVTIADKTSEKLIIKELSLLLPEAGYYAEESGKNNIDRDYFWIIDPLDGTSNFVNGISHFCISIALSYKNEIALGVIYDPILNEMFYAVKGKGAYLNGVRIKVSDQQDIFKSFIGIDYLFYDKKIFELFKKAGAVRFLGATALDLAYVASGRLDAEFTSGVFLWDVAAGKLLVEEAGGLASNYKGGKIKPGFKGVIASNPILYDALLDFLIDHSI